jgi:hypothetical protein
VVLVLGVKLEPSDGRATVWSGGDEILGFIGYRVTGGNETGNGTKIAADGSKGLADGVAGGGLLVILAGENVVAKKVERVVTVTAEVVGDLPGKMGKRRRRSKLSW